MTTYLITYDLSDPSKETALLEYIRGHAYAQAAKSSYAVLSDKSASAIVDDIRTICGDAVVVYVFAIRRPYSGFGGKDVNDWLDQNVPA